jgi:hypothetical protein
MGVIKYWCTGASGQIYATKTRRKLGGLVQMHDDIIHVRKEREQGGVCFIYKIWK